MAKEHCTIKMVILNIPVILSMMNMKVMENIFMKMETIILANGYMVKDMAKGHYMIKIII